MVDLKVLFICEHNSARSQMAEAFLNSIYSDSYTAYSAGVDPGSLNPVVVKVMGECGIDISQKQPKSIEEFLKMDLDCVVTVCDQARETCPFFPGASIYIHKGFIDPSCITGSQEYVEERVRIIRDEIREWIIQTFDPPHFQEKYGKG
ncbi:MAG: arsenate reductase ArsC [Theionarchaea archaeon]|nr:arsenate reductase ArsC [Theionarchaea archaeon]